MNKFLVLILTLALLLPCFALAEETIAVADGATAVHFAEEYLASLA